MGAPVTPSDFRNLIVEPGAKFCRIFLNFGKGLVLLYKLVNWLLTPTGEVSEAFRTSLGIPSGSVPSTTPLSAPGGISATDGTFNDKIEVTWTTVTGAASYEIFRSDSSDFATAISRGTVTTTTFDDSSITVGSTYYFWVVAKDAAGNKSSPSVSDTGFAAAAGAGGGGTLLLQRFSQSGQFVVPPGMTTIWAKMWGTGGGGGSGRAPFLPVPPSGTTIYGGGGGGSGEYIKIGAIPVSGGEILHFIISPIGGTGSQGTGDGAQGLTTQLQRADGSVIARAFGGHGGTFGALNPSSGGAGGGGGGSNQGTLLEFTPGHDGSGGASAPYPTPAAGGAGGTALTGSTNQGGTGGNGYLSFGRDGGGGAIEFYK